MEEGLFTPSVLASEAFWHSGILQLCGPSGVVYLNFLLVGIFPSSASSVSPPPSKSHRDAEAHVDLGLTSTGMTRHLSYPISTGLDLISCLCLAASQHVRTGQDRTAPKAMTTCDSSTLQHAWHGMLYSRGHDADMSIGSPTRLGCTQSCQETESERVHDAK